MFWPIYQVQEVVFVLCCSRFRLEISFDEDNLCSTGAVPEISKVTPEKAGALFVAGYNGDEFQPGYQSGPGSVDPVELAKGFTSLVHHIYVA